MAYHGSSQCHGCSAEDCCCCEVYLEERASQQASMEQDPDDWDDDDYDEDDDDEDDPCDMDGDHDTAMTSIGWGTDEDYGCFGASDD